jgi:prepilin-type N-terminal cleavage/methylation domain-containing protein
MRSRGAFTLVELLLSLTIMAVMLTMVGSTILAVRRNAEVRGGVDRFIAMHSLARATAVRMGRTAQLRADNAAGRVWVEVGGKTYGEVRFAEVKIRALRQNVCFDARGLAIKDVVVSGLICESAADTVVFSHSGRSETLRTTLLGRIMR